MGKTTSKIKYKWNKRRYIMVKTLVRADIAAALKAALAVPSLYDVLNIISEVRLNI